ncbi:MAG: hypothetical protein KIT16_19150 [Rhodospirillaceae bacterium]|nr:hypothetical protein [Rhodospirillaceae bacterium]
MKRRCGYITVASGSRRYLDMAIDLALSLRAFDDKPVALVLEDALRCTASPAELAVFDHLLALPPDFPAYLGKLATPYVTPFERTFFVDADSVAVGPLGEVWSALEGLGFAAQGKYVGRDDDYSHNQLSTAALCRHFGIARYLRHNSGVFYFENEAGKAVSQACLDLWIHGFGRKMPFDEPLRAIVADRMGIATMPKPYPMAWGPSYVTPQFPKYSLVHFMAPVRADTLTWILRDVRRRREAAGLPWREAIRIWLNKATHGKRPWQPEKFPHLAYRRPGGGISRGIGGTPTSSEISR